MNKDAIRKWVSALEGTEYVESSGFLRSAAGYSREGVLTDVFRKEFGGEWVESKSMCPQIEHLFVPHLEFLPKNPMADQFSKTVSTGYGYAVCYEALKWLDLRCSPKECPRDPDSTKNDPRIDHCRTCEANNFFDSILEHELTFEETAKAIRKLYPNVWT